MNIEHQFLSFGRLRTLFIKFYKSVLGEKKRIIDADIADYTDLRG